jgi:starvation-inducible outer membrane lipoprotein
MVDLWVLQRVVWWVDRLGFWMVGRRVDWWVVWKVERLVV